jgi:AraC-like DNA-binding protein
VLQPHVLRANSAQLLLSRLDSRGGSYYTTAHSNRAGRNSAGIARGDDFGGDCQEKAQEKLQIALKSKNSTTGMGPAHDGDFKAGYPMRRILPTVAPSRTFSGNDITGELFVFRHAEVADIECSSASHLIILLPDGNAGLCECYSGDRVDKFRSMAPNTIIFNPAQQYLHLRLTRTRDQCRVFLLTIEPTVLTHLDDDDLEQLNEELCPQIGVDDPTIRQALEAILQEIENQSEHSGLYVETFVTLTLIRLLKYQLRRTRALPHGYVRGGLASWRLKRALQLIESNSNKMPALAEIADAVHLHQASFCRAFKQSTGLSPHHYLLVNRVTRAKEMMKDPSRTLTDIAFACGFSSSSQFSVVFKRIVGKPPRKYRCSL